MIITVLFKLVYKKIQGRYKFIISVRKARKTLRNIASFLNSKRVHVLYVELPNASKIKNLSDFEKERIDNWSFDFNNYKQELPKLQMLYGKDVTEEYINSIFDGGVVVKGERRRILLDFKSDHQHIINGRRLTVDQPAKYHNSIFTHGACTWRGTGVEDQETIASFLQSKLNLLMPNNYRVVNSAIGRGSSIHDDYEIIKEQEYNEGDIVVIGSHGSAMASIKPSFYKMIGIEYIETSSLFDRPHAIGEWFNDDTLHTNKRGNKIIADKIYTTLNHLCWLSQKDVSVISKRKLPMPPSTETITKGEKIYGDNPDLIKYIESIKPYIKGDSKSKNGSIVMNCNPFTLGHRYLIEYAAYRVDYLYIFVVEENKSFFPFEDRFKLVQQGTADLSNVVVLPSGNFIISAVTFPGYFYKENLKETKIDCSNDLNVFAQYIAPALNIKVRFAGEEPLDPITKQYNEGMAEILPYHGIEFCEIPRKQDDEGVGVISASRVRNLLKEKDFNSLKKLVPLTTYNYLLTFEYDSNK